MASAVDNPHFKAPQMPAYIPYDMSQLEDWGIRQDRQFYNLSDTDFAARHPGMLTAEQAFETQTAKDQTGNTELLPAMQGEFMRAGLSNALGSFGGASTVDGAVTNGTLAPGSAGEADVARNLGEDIQGFQQQQRQNRLTSLTAAEQLFPRRSFGMSGADADNISMANTLGYNNWNQADFATKFQTDQFNYLVDAQNRQADAQAHNIGAQASAMKSGAIWSGVFNSLGSLVGAAGSAAGGGGGMMCWVAREVFGHEQRNGVLLWKAFREWMRRFASPAFWQAYLTNGPIFAEYLRFHPEAKAAIRPFFEQCIAEIA